MAPGPEATVLQRLGGPSVPFQPTALIRIKAGRRGIRQALLMSDAQAYRDLARRYREWAEVSNTSEREQRLRLATQLEELARVAEDKAAQASGATKSSR